MKFLITVRLVKFLITVPLRSEVLDICTTAFLITGLDNCTTAVGEVLDICTTAVGEVLDICTTAVGEVLDICTTSGDVLDNTTAVGKFDICTTSVVK